VIHALASVVLVIAQVCLVLAMGPAIFRMARGPHAQDRIAGLDAMYVDAMLLLLTFGLATGSLLYLEASLIIAVLGFAGSSALARFLLRGEVIE
jgi:multicomponent K+:H+ antiporter subunit F